MDWKALIRPMEIHKSIRDVIRRSLCEIIKISHDNHNGKLVSNVLAGSTMENENLIQSRAVKIFAEILARRGDWEKKLGLVVACHRFQGDFVQISLTVGV